MHVWVERWCYLGTREAVYSNTERTSSGYGHTQTARAYTPHAHSHRGGGQCSQLWIQCVGGGGMMIAGELSLRSNREILKTGVGVLSEYAHIAIFCKISCVKSSPAFSRSHCLSHNHPHCSLHWPPLIFRQSCHTQDVINWRRFSELRLSQSICIYLWGVSWKPLSRSHNYLSTLAWDISNSKWLLNSVN